MIVVQDSFYKNLLEVSLATDAADETVLPLPNLAKAYARQVQHLEDVLRDPAYVQRAHEAIASLIDKVLLYPKPESPDGLKADVHGDLAKILSTCAAAGLEKLPSGFFSAGSKVSVVAGVGFGFDRTSGSTVPMFRLA